MQAFATASKLDWSGWFYGVWTSTMSGAWGAVAGISGPMLTDAKDFNLGSGLSHTLESMAIGFLLTGLFSLAKFLQVHPAPDKVQESLADAATANKEAGEAIGQAQKDAQK